MTWTDPWWGGTCGLPRSVVTWGGCDWHWHPDTSVDGFSALCNESEERTFKPADAKRTEHMSDATRAQRIHNLDVTVWVGKNGIDVVTDELDDQLGDREFVKVKFHRAARGGTDAETLAAELAERVGATVVQTRGHTAVLER